MDISFDLIIGIVAVFIGCATLLARIFGWHGLLSKRELMKQKFGDRAGDLIHLAAYTIVPIVAGLVFLRRTFAL